MTTQYVIPECPGTDPGGDWREMGWCCHDCAALAHIQWCARHPGWRESDLMRYGCRDDGVPVNPGTPVLFTLTPKADAFLDRTAPGCHEGTAIIDGPDEWACEICQYAYFGTRSDDGLCEPCHAASEATLACDRPGCCKRDES